MVEEDLSFLLYWTELYCIMLKWWALQRWCYATKTTTHVVPPVIRVQQSTQGTVNKFPYICLCPISWNPRVLSYMARELDLDLQNVIKLKAMNWVWLGLSSYVWHSYNNSFFIFLYYTVITFLLPLSSFQTLACSPPGSPSN